MLVKYGPRNGLNLDKKESNYLVKWVGLMKNQQHNLHGGNSEKRPLPIMDIILDSVAAPVFVLRGSKILHANPPALELTGKNRQDLLLSDFIQLFEGISADEKERLAGCLKEAVQAGQAECETHFIARSGRRVRLLFRPVDPQSLKGSGQLSARDADMPIPHTGQAADSLVMITVMEFPTAAEDQAPANALAGPAHSSAAVDHQPVSASPSDASLPPEFQHQRDLLETIFAADPGALAVVSGPDLIFRSANPAYLELILEPGSDPVGKPYSEVWPGEHALERTEAIQKVIETGVPVDDDEVEIVYPHGQRRYLSFRIRPLSWNGEPGALLVVWDLSELEAAHNRAEVAIEEASRRAGELKDVIHAIPDVVFIFDMQGLIRQTNPATRDLLGFDPAGQQREALLEQVRICHPDGQRILDVSEMPSTRALQNQRVRGQRLIVTNSQGRSVEVLASSTPLYNNGELIGAVSIWSDVSELTRRRRELEALVQVAAAMRNTITQEEMFPAALQQVMELLDVNGISIIMPDAATGELVVRAAAGAWEETMGHRSPAGTGISAQILLDGRRYINNDIQTDPRLSRAIFAGDLACGACVPLNVQGVNNGVLWVGRNRPFSEGEMHLLSAIADITASSLYRARLFEQTQLRFQRLSALHSIDMAITSSLDLQLTLSVLLDHVVSQMGVEAAAILRFDPALHWLEFASGRGFLVPSAHPNTLRLGDTPAGQAALERRTVVIPDISEWEMPTESWLTPQEGFRAYFAAPLIAKGQVKGVLELYRREVFRPDDEWLEFLVTLATQAAIALDSAELFNRLQRSNEELQLAYDATIEGWSRALELRDQETKDHSRRVTEMTTELARRMGISDEEIAVYRRGVLLHDIGKMAIPDSLLLKDGPLTPEETEVMHMHPVYAYDLLRPIAYLRPSLDIPYCHHEWWDGRGYPRGLKGEDIPLSARIFAVVDVWDALCSARSYRPAWPVHKVLDYIRAHSGTQFDPRIVEPFIQMIADRQTI